ncbi:MAG: NAD(P)H-dependent oxidoreductase [Candidatus Magasanikbacteria bacterium]|uniref:Flavodoxin-like fold domain-containing protein n=1 Tax=Candidatus Magasanikbacteria bacterium CG10_big_fil_rev_8_21_14_0_10_38_6 TaxID=1974647 RepID=A0A2M6P0Y6_9BACT|nr:NAD(P)H-dependent oxidoreductase [Candidatus Magasanikbacteria bacterium]PIR77338.1 MAG: hypothetical protein COU30_03020 [Candidatus Magasanikbacteria bacterium CG10_big_fil_rev_8_21_14_0_10_38_6]
MNHAFIIYCHPHSKSHNAKILKRVVDTLEKQHVSYDLLDLYQSDFTVFLTEKEYERMAITKERVTEPDVLAMQERITKASHLIFIYPVWWYNMPAKLKGFMDRVFSNGFAYQFKQTPSWQLLGARCLSFFPGIRYCFQPYSVHGFLKDKKALIFRTYGGPPLGRRFFGDTPKVLEQAILRFCGLTDITIHELYNVDKKEVFTKEKERVYLNGVEKIVEILAV